MSAEPTALAASEAAQSFVRAELARAVQETGVSLAALGVACGKRSPTIAEGWQSGAKHLPVWVLGDAEAVPRRVFDALLARVEDLRGDRAAHPPVASPEAACAVALARGGESAGTLGWALANGKVDPHERPEIRARMLAEIAQCQAVVRSIDEADTADARKGAAS